MTTTTSLLIEPSLLKKIEGLQIVSRRLYQGGQSGTRKSRSRGGGMEFAEHREYSPGDDFRAIDWNVFARHDDFVIKIFETEQNLHISILVDSSASMGFGEPGKLEFAASLAAAIAYIALVNEDNISITAMSDRVADEISSTNRNLSPGQVFDFCGKLEADGETLLDDALKAFAFHRRQPGLLFIISDFLVQGRLQDMLQPLVYMGYDICGIHLLGQEELNPHFSGEMDIVDSETDEIIPLTTRGDTAQQYQESLRRFLNQTEVAIKMCHGNYVRVSPGQSLERVLLGELRSLGIITE
ncbi:MAG: DUF58 domain-containing protein [Planctomycetota bacterium]|nr:DUF58 domain-containing protein [Planctomycetota bacterium]MDA1137888.1 DUF58 domain-containing protein [Planctomycetota bacterium]